MVCLPRYNNYDEFFQDSFQRHNATIGVVLSFPFFSASQRARAEAADATALKAKKDAETAKNQVSEETLDCSARSNRWPPPRRWPISNTGWRNRT